MIACIPGVREGGLGEQDAWMGSGWNIFIKLGQRGVIKCSLASDGLTATLLGLVQSLQVAILVLWSSQNCHDDSGGRGSGCP